MVEIVIVLVLIVANGLFSMSETAVVSARKARLQQRADDGDAGARRALALAEAPNSFLATVQIGITLIGVVSGAFGGAAVAGTLASALVAVPPLTPYAEQLALGLVVAAITYLSLVLGELVPKRVALNNPERIAAAVAGPMQALSRLATPVVRLLGASTDAALAALRVRRNEEPPVTEDEIGVLLEQGARAGVFAHTEREMVGRIFDLHDDPVTALMTPRPEIAWIDAADPPAEHLRLLALGAHSQYPVCRGDADHVVGVVRTQDLLAGALAGRPDVVGAMRPPLLVPESASALLVLEALRQAGEHMALVVDEYGGIAGLVTLTDVLAAIVGDLPSAGAAADQRAMRREDGSWLLDGTLPLDELTELLPLSALPEGARTYRTLGGFALDRLGRIPSVGEHFTWESWRFEVVDMDGNRVDKVLAAREAKPPGAP